MTKKRFEISKLYEGPPITTPWGATEEGMHETALTARTRIAILEAGLPKIKYLRGECVDAENDEWDEVK
jgi:hypothetical protein